MKSELLRFEPVVGSMSQQDFEPALFSRLSGTLSTGAVARHEAPTAGVRDTGQQDLRILHADDAILVEQGNEPQRAHLFEPPLYTPVVLVIAGHIVASQARLQVGQGCEMW